MKNNKQTKKSTKAATKAFSLAKAKCAVRENALKKEVLNKKVFRTITDWFAVRRIPLPTSPKKELNENTEIFKPSTKTINKSTTKKKLTKHTKKNLKPSKSQVEKENQKINAMKDLFGFTDDEYDEIFDEEN